MRSWLSPVGAGLLLGACWGVLARIWMRLITDSPTFTWSGTLMIIGLAAFVGMLLGLVVAARRQRSSGWWRLAPLPGLMLFAGPGMVLFPAFLLGGWAWSGRGPLLGRAVAGIALLVLPVLIWTSMSHLDRVGLSPISVVGGFWVLEATLAAAGGVWFRPWPSPSLEELRTVPASA